MRNYVIINGVSSLTIEGLAINILPAITKPLMRNEIEEIDGRDGDIITELGYSAYDKEMEIGLWGNYDIDEIIKFFTGEGTVIFSTEPDKYYNFKILNQIDYDKLLKFRTATVVFHCQPFKYPTEEEPIEVEPVVKTGEGETITIDDTSEGNLQMLLKGNTYQDSTTGKNLVDVADRTNISSQTTLFTKSLDSGTYTISALINNTGTAGGYLRVLDSSNNVIANANTINASSTGTSFASFTLSESKTIKVNAVGVASGYNLNISKIQLEVGNQATSYEPYTNGASPNPDYPQEVHTVSGDNEVEVVGKNLFDKDNGTFISKTIGSNTRWGYKLPKANNDFYVSKVAVSIGGYYIYEDVNGTMTALKEVKTTPQIITNSSNDFYMLCLSTSGQTTAKQYFDSDSFMVSYTNDTYTPYSGTTYPINLPEGMFLGSIGDYQDKFIRNSGNNLFDGEIELGSISPDDGSLSSSTTRTRSKNFIKVKPNTTYSYTRTGGQIRWIVGYKEDKTGITDGTMSGHVAGIISIAQGTLTFTFTTTATTEYIKWYDTSSTNINELVMINEGETALPYEPYGTNEWYLEKKIEKIVFDGSEDNWLSQTGTHTYISNFYVRISPLPKNAVRNIYSNYFKYNENAGSNNDTTPNIMKTNYNASLGYGYILCDVLQSDFPNVTSFKTWLSTHNTEVYYPLATPTYTKIEGTLASQLEAVYNAVSYEGQTNIGQTNDDLPFWIEATITFTPPSTIENIGNIYAKPILTITGSGNVGVVLNGIEILQINLGEGNTIAIDVPNLEAYNPNDNTLMNRLVTGDYMKLLIQEGENTLSFNGDVSSYSVTNYTRWI